MSFLFCLSSENLFHPQTGDSEKYTFVHFDLAKSTFLIKLKNFLTKIGPAHSTFIEFSGEFWRINLDLSCPVPEEAIEVSPKLVILDCDFP